MEQVDQSNNNLKEVEKTPQAENLFEVLIQSPLKQQNIINLLQFQWQGVAKNLISKKKKSLDKPAQVSPKAVL